MQKASIFEGKLYAFSMLIALAFLVQFLWIAFTIVGLVVFGYYPATIAAFQTLRHFKNSDTPYKEIPTFYLKSYLNHFKHGNVIGVVNIIVIYILVTNMRLTSVMQSDVNIYIYTLFVGILIAFFVLQPYLLMVISESKVSIKRTISCAVLLAFSSPFSSITIFIILIVYGIGLWLVPSIYMVLGISVPLLLLVSWAEPKIRLLTLSLEEYNSGK